MNNNLLLKSLLTYCDQICESTLADNLFLYTGNIFINIGEIKNDLKIKQKYFFK